MLLIGLQRQKYRTIDGHAKGRCGSGWPRLCLPSPGWKPRLCTVMVNSVSWFTRDPVTGALLYGYAMPIIPLPPGIWAKPFGGEHGWGPIMEPTFKGWPWLDDR